MVWAALLVCFLLPYTRVNAWGFIPAFVAIIFCADRLWHERKWERLGIRMSARSAFASLFAVGALVLVLHPLILHLAARAGLNFDTSAWPPLLRTRPIFQALNEEMLFRAVLLGMLVRRFDNKNGNKKWTHFSIVVGTAAFFSCAHLAFYIWKDGTWIGPGALWNLFVFSLVCNALYFRFRHIGYGYALHLGWNLTRFGGDFTRNGQIVPEGMTFNLIEGAWPVTVGFALFAVPLLVWIYRGRNSPIQVSEWP